MPTAENAAIYLEQGAALVPFAALTDSGDRQTFTAADSLWSGKQGLAPEVRPNGIVTGRNLLSPHATANTVTVAAFTAYSMGVLRTVAAGSVLVTRPATAVAKVVSVTMTSAGAIAAVAGTDGATTTFSETRGAAGGPPEIPVDSVELGQVRMVSNTSAVLTASELNYQVPGQHSERFDFPGWSVDNVGQGLAAETAAKTGAHVKFAATLPAIHTGAAPKRVYLQYYTPVMAELARALDFSPAETSHSVSSKQFYNGTVGSRSSSLGQAKFTALLSDGVSDALVGDKNKILTVKFFPDRNKTPFVLTQGAVGIDRTFPVADQIQASVTLTSEKASAEFSN